MKLGNEKPPLKNCTFKNMLFGHSDNRLFYAKLLIAICVIFGAKLWFIQECGSSIPYYEDWRLIPDVIQPWLNNHLILSDLLAAHNEHRPFFTRLLSLGLFIVNLQYDPLVGVVLNALLSTLTAIFILIVIKNHLGLAVENLSLVFIVILWSVPYDWENLIWYFGGSQWYIMIFLNLVALWGMLFHDNFTFKWWLGIFAGILAFFNLASGFFAFVVIFVLKSYLIVIDSGHRKSHLPALLISFVVSLVCGLLIPESPASRSFIVSHFDEFIGSLGNNLAWPWIPHRPLSLLIYLPFIVFTLRTIWLRRRPTPIEAFVLSIGGWVILHALMLAYARAGRVYFLVDVGTLSRYMDFMALGIVANFLALHFLAAEWFGMPAAIKRRLVVYVNLWGTFFVGGMLFLAMTQLGEGLPHIAKWLSWRRADHFVYTRDFLLNGDMAVFQNKPYGHIPYPEHPEYLATVLTDKEARGLLPSNLILPDLLKADAQIIVENQENTLFIADGIAHDKKKYLGETVLGSFTATGASATAWFVSEPMMIAQEFLEIPVTGHLGADSGGGLALQLETADGSPPVIVKPPAAPQEHWFSCYVKTPKQPFRVVAVDRRADQWFGFAMPRGVGGWSLRVKQLLSHGKMLFFIGITLLWLVIGYGMSKEFIE